MKMFNKASLSGFFGLSDDEDYDNSVYEEENKSSYVQPEKSTVKKETSYRQPTDSSYKSYEEPRKSPAKKVVAMSSQQNRGAQSATHDASVSQGISKKVTVLEPRTYTEAKKIAQCVFRNEIVIVNFHLIEESQARRIVDFLTGAVFGLDGDIQRIGDEMFLCTPPNMEIDSTVAKSLLGTQFAEY